MNKKIFLTGTDTGIGKTTVSVIILKKLNILGYNVAGYKPIAAGCEKKYGFYNNDALLLQKYSSEKFQYNEINPFCLKEFLPPNFIKNSNSINFKKISEGLNNISKKSNRIVIEGIGGWCTPIFKKFTFSDWIKKQKIAVVLIVGIKLGCINHAILTEKAIVNSGVKFYGWYSNCITYEKYILNYIYTIKKYIQAPYLGNIPYIKDINNSFEISKINICLPI
ncbi:dethiobiotin synthase [Buchnera aphidicola]|uniref:dethiobiotin synthase n=1 Tax=Buchnera aphidicola TaxID=9 RepID=UPI0031B87F55